MKVTTYVINKGQVTQYYGLRTVEDNKILHSAPNNWKTEVGALNWALKHGYEVVPMDDLAREFGDTFNEKVSMILEYEQISERMELLRECIAAPAVEFMGTIESLLSDLSEYSTLECRARDIIAALNLPYIGTQDALENLKRELGMEV